MQRQSDPAVRARFRQDVGSVAHAAAVLQCLRDVDTLGVTEIARRLGVAKSTAHRLLATLCTTGLVTRDDDGRYGLGVELYDLGQSAASRHALRTAAKPLLHDLLEETGLTVALVWPTPHGVLHLDRAEPRQALPLWHRRGVRFPACGAGGIVIAAQDTTVPWAARADAGRAATLPSQDSLARARDAGYAVEFGHVVPRIASLAVAIRRLGRALAAVAVIGPEAAFRGHARANRLAQLTAQAAHLLERQPTA